MRFARYLFASVAVAAAIFAAVLACASASYAQDTPDSSTLAEHLVPFRAAYLVRYAAWHPDVKTQTLERAVALNPFETQAWIDLGLHAEFSRHAPAEAERLYLQAEATNHMFVAKWTLANFYFRQQQLPKFLHWARETLAITPYSARPVFSEMWDMAPNSSALLADAVPNNPNTLWQYAWFLSNERHLPEIPPVVSRLVHHASPRDAELFGRSSIIGPIEDKLLQNGYSGEALQIWTSLDRAHWVAEPAPTMVQPVTNGDFASPIWPHGFDWLPISTPGISTQQDTNARQFEIDFSGDQPDPCAVLQQWIPLDSGHIYTLHWKADLGTADTLADVTWHIRTGIGKELAASPPFAHANGAWTFTFPGPPGAYLLSLEYARQPGYTRAESPLTLKAITASSN